MPTYPDLFDAVVVEETLQRLAALRPETPPLWGQMNAAQMLAHLNVAYDMAFDADFPRQNPITRWVLRAIVKQKVVGPAPYPRNTPTAPAFRIREARDFARERDRLTAFLRRVAQEGRAAFEGRESPSFGPLTAQEWNGLFSKHLAHHFAQFGL